MQRTKRNGHFNFILSKTIIVVIISYLLVATSVIISFQYNLQLLDMTDVIIIIIEHREMSGIKRGTHAG